jgi:co-chaperonin GroES (HSP10)
MKNESGIHPKGYAVLVRLDPVETKIGFLEKTEQQIAEAFFSQTKATVVEIGPLAWADEVVEGQIVPRCAVGDKVIIKRYAGETIEGNDKDEKGKPIQYRLLGDKDIFAIRSE